MLHCKDNIRSAGLALTSADLRDIEERLADIAIHGVRLSKELMALSEEQKLCSF